MGKRWPRRSVRSYAGCMYKSLGWALATRSNWKNLRGWEEMEDHRCGIEQEIGEEKQKMSEASRESAAFDQVTSCR